MIVGIIGLGLIGGSLAKAYKRDKNVIVSALDKDDSVTDFAILSGAVDKKLTRENIEECDLILIAVYPDAAVEFLNDYSSLISKNTVVIDCLGVKKEICDIGFELAKKYGFTFAGGHPMAGTHNSGFKYSRENLFHNAPMVIVPPRYDDITLLDKIKSMLSPVGFGSITVTTAEEHDRVIAFTSQMAHIVSNGFIKSPTAQNHKGFSAGSFKDLTRVAWLNPQMWAELFLKNKEPLLFELDLFIDNMLKYKKALEEDDKNCLVDLLEEGRQLKKSSQ